MVRFIKSVAKSIGKGVSADPEMRKVLERYPRFFRFVKKRLTPDEQFGLYLTVGASIALVFVYFFFKILENLMTNESIIQSDLRIINLVQIFRTPRMNQVMLFITYLGKLEIVAFALGIASFLIALMKRWRYLIVLLTSVVGGELFILAMKHAIQRQRPPLLNSLVQENSFSFPSGHSFVAFSFYGLLAYFLIRSTKKKTLKILAGAAGVVIILAIGFSRIYLGVHWPGDVLASFAAGAAWLSAFITALEIRKKFHPRTYGKPFMKKFHILLLGFLLCYIWGFYVWYYFYNHPLRSQVITNQSQISVSIEDIPNNIFAFLPRTSETITGEAMEPIGIIVISTEEQLNNAFNTNGWCESDPITPRTFWRLAKTSICNKPYDQAPGTPTFWNAIPNDFSFEQPTARASSRQRHHIHFWKTPFTLADGRKVWLGTAHFDQDIKFIPGVFLPTHVIDPAIDKERDRIKSELMSAGIVESFAEFQIVEPTLGSNQAGDQFFTDGKAYVFYLKD